LFTAFPQPGYRRLSVALAAISILAICCAALFVDKAALFIAETDAQFEIFGWSIPLSKLPLDAITVFLFIALVFTLVLGVEKIAHFYFTSAYKQLREEYQAMQAEVRTRRLMSVMLHDAGVTLASCSGLPNAEPVDQEYARALVSTASKGATKSFCMASATGYKYLGDSNAILYRTLLANKGTDLRILLVHPTTGMEAFAQRAKELCRDGVTAASLSEEVKQVVSKLQFIKSQRGPQHGSVQVRFRKTIPPFRLHISDLEAFISAYHADKHGHESAMLVFAQPDNSPDVKESFYRPFSALFDYWWIEAEEDDALFVGDLGAGKQIRGPRTTSWKMWTQKKR